MPVRAKPITLVAATATQVVTGATGSATMPVSIVIWNATGATLFVGGDDVDTSGAHQGLPVANASFSPSFDLVGEDLWVKSAGGGVINILATRQ